MAYVYLLECTTPGVNKSYLGKTTDPKRRLAQHNGLRAGGARATRGHQWKMKYLIGGFPDERSALQAEINGKKSYRCAILSRLKTVPSVRARVRELQILLGVDTSTAVGKRMRHMLFAMQKERFTAAALPTVEMDLWIVPDCKL